LSAISALLMGRLMPNILHGGDLSGHSGLQTLSRLRNLF
jgi:hypothetical protein